MKTPWVPSTENQVKRRDDIRDKFWNLYYSLKDYKINPNDTFKREITKDFDELISVETDYPALQELLKKISTLKNELLLILERPEMPLHNNLSENDIRTYVKKRKISGSTRSNDGRLCRDTFASLKKTCKKQGIKFWHYLLDRIHGAGEIEWLPVMVARSLRQTHAPPG